MSTLRAKLILTLVVIGAACALALPVMAASGRGGSSRAGQDAGRGLGSLPGSRALPPTQPSSYQPPAPQPTPTPRRRKDARSSPFEADQLPNSGRPAAAYPNRIYPAAPQRAFPSSARKNVEERAESARRGPERVDASTGGDRPSKKKASSKRTEVQRSSKVVPPARAPASNRPTTNSAPAIVAPATLPPVIAPPFPQTLPPQESMTAPVVQARPASQHDIDQTLPNLSADERAKLYSAHEAAMHDPDLTALRERYLQEKRAYREELQRALLKADPSVQPILEKVRKRPSGDK